MEVMGLDQLRSTLIRLEETIIFGIIERAQYKQNDAVYIPGKYLYYYILFVFIFLFSGKLGNGRFDCSFLDYIFVETEKVHALVRRYVW